MQPIEDRNQDISAIVPIHLGLYALSTEAKQGGLDISDAQRVVAEWYNADMASYLGYLEKEGYSISHLRGYEEFHPDWRLDAEPSSSEIGFLQLIWRENGEIHTLRPDSIPVPFYNQHDENGDFYTPEVWARKGIFPLAYRSVIDPVFLFMVPAKMRQYGAEVPELHAVIDPVGGIAEVIGLSFNSDYYSNLAKALLLRNFGVHYVNQLVASLEIPD